MKLLKFCLIAALSVSWSAFAANLAIIDTSGDEIYIEGIKDGWENVNAVVNQDIHEIKSAVILQPGPASLSEGIDQLYAITKKWHDEL